MLDDCHYRKDKFVMVLPPACPPKQGSYRWIKWQELWRLWEKSGHRGVLCAEWDCASRARGGKGVAGYARKGCKKGHFKLTEQGKQDGSRSR